MMPRPAQGYEIETSPGPGGENNGDVAASKEAEGSMSIDTGSSTEAGLPWSSSSTAGSRGLFGRAARRRLAAGGIAEVRGPAASMRRDSLFRRMLLVGRRGRDRRRVRADGDALAPLAAADLGRHRRACRSCSWGPRSPASTTATRRCCARPRSTRRRSCFSSPRCARSWRGSPAACSSAASSIAARRCSSGSRWPRC